MNGSPIQIVSIPPSDRIHPNLLLGLSETNGSLAEVVNGVPLSEECIAEDCQWAYGLGEVHSHKAGDTRSLDLKNIIVWGNAEVIPAKGEGHVWQTITLLTLNSILSVIALLGTYLLVQELSKSRWKSDKRSSCVKYNTGVLKLGSVIAESNGIKINFPVRLASQWDTGNLASIVVLVDTTESSLRLVTLAIVGIAEVESKHWLIQQTLLDHIVKWRRDLVNRDGIESEAQDAIESTKGKSQTWLLGSFGEDLVLDLEISDGHHILRHKTAETAGAIADLERCSVLLVCR